MWLVLEENCFGKVWFITLYQEYLACMFGTMLFAEHM